MEKAFIAFIILMSALQAAAVVPHDEPDPEKYMSIDTQGSCRDRDVTVTVTRFEGTPLRDVEIDVFFMSRKVAYGKTDEKGVFVFRPDSGGSYKLTAKRSGYKDAEAVINISRQCGGGVPTTTSTTTTSTPTTQLATTTTTTTPSTTTTTKPACNNNGVCEPWNNENYGSCRRDCPSGSSDGVCDRAIDGRCDPDCKESEDSDCICNANNKCDKNENFMTCPRDCPSGSADGICDKAVDGRCDPDCAEADDAECKKQDYTGIVITAIAIIIIFGIIAAMNTRREMRKMQTEKADDELIEELKSRLKEGEDPAALRKELASAGRDVSILAKAEERLWE